MVLYSGKEEINIISHELSTEELCFINEDRCSNSDQIGIVEFLPLAGGFQLRVNAEGKHLFCVFKLSGETVLKPSIITPYDPHVISGLETGMYVVKVLINKERMETLLIPVNG